jgi:hypothetical protein
MGGPFPFPGTPMTSDPSLDRAAPVAPPADHGAGQLTLLQRIAGLRAWLFLAPS